MCVKVIGGGASRRVTAYSNTETFQTVTSWMPVPGYRSMSFNLYANQPAAGKLSLRPGIQYAAVRPDNPDNPITVGSSTVVDGYERFDAGAQSTDDKMFWRKGYWYAASSGGFGAADVSMTVSANTAGRVVGKRTMSFNQPSTTVAEAYPISDWFTMEDAKNCKVALIFESVITGNMQWRILYRGGDDRRAPSNWNGLGAGYTGLATGNSEVAPALLDLTSYASNFYGQLGIALQRTATNGARGTLHAVAALTGE